MTFILASLLKSGTQQGEVKTRLDLFKNEMVEVVGEI